MADEGVAVGAEAAFGPFHEQRDQFVQCTAVDRYHFNTDHLMYEGETLYDLVDAVQTAGLLPGPSTSSFTWMMRGAAFATRVATTFGRTAR